MPRIFLLFSVVFMVSATGCQPGMLGKGLQEDVATAITSADSIELISINPNFRKGGDYHGWQELGRATIESAATQKEIVAKLDDAINRSDGTVAGCFNPRHAVLAKHEGKTYEVIICFECMSLLIQIDGKRVGSETITQAHSGYFNQLLTNAKLPIAE